MDINALIAEFNETKEKFVREMRKGFDGYIRQFIKDDVVGIRWTQYTPYFNDGDECVFCVHDTYVRFKDTPDDAGDCDDGYLTLWDCEDKQRKKIIQGINEALAKIPSEIMQDVLGDHIQVTVNEDGLTTEEYEHD